MNQALKNRYVFGEFRLESAERQLLRNGSALPLAPKVFDTLVLLVANAGHLVEKDEFMKELWPDTFVGEDALARNISILRKTLGESSDSQTYIATVPTRGYRFVATVQVVVSSKPGPVGNQHKGQTDGSVLSSEEKDEEQQRVSQQEAVLPPKPGPVDRRTFTLDSWRSRMALLALVLAAGSGAGLITFYLLSLHHGRALTDKDTIVLADFTNTTGDRVFDGTLREGLAVQLQQSPFLSLVPEDRIQQTLRLMEKPPDTKITPEIARGICQRTGSKAVLNGAIFRIGTQYLLTLKALNCSNSEPLASLDAHASDKNEILTVLSKLASKMRSALGESLNTVQKFDTPLAEATTPSLEALRAFSLGVRSEAELGNDADSIAFFQGAIQLDPNFAAAYDWLATAFDDLGESARAAENARKAYELRERVSERERFAIETDYHISVTGDFQKAQQSAELWAQIYPRDQDAFNLLGISYDALGQNEKALAAYQKALQLDPSSNAIYYNLVDSNLLSNRFDQAKALTEEAEAKNKDSPDIRYARYELAFLRNDEAEMARIVAWSAGKPGVEDVLLFNEAATSAFHGRLRKARALTDGAVTSAVRAGETETASIYEAEAALREALFGNVSEARQLAMLALRLSHGRLTQFRAALAFVFAGEDVRAMALASDLNKHFPESTLVQFNYLPSIRGALLLSRNQPLQAIEALVAAAPFELGWHGPIPLAPLSIYFRGQAYLSARQPAPAVAEFQKIFDHRGLGLNSPNGPLALLGFGRACTMSGDIAKAKAAYQDLLTLWKDADPDIPVLKQAKAEYARLQ